VDTSGLSTVVCVTVFIWGVEIASGYLTGSATGFGSAGLRAGTMGAG